MRAEDVRHWDYIDALRGMAALAVVVVHTHLLFPQLPWRAAQLASLGAHGVQLFFMVSAITLASSWRERAHREENPAAAFYVRRLFRIAPMFWSAALFYVGLASISTPFWKNGILDAGSIYLTALFSHGWLPSTINAVVPGGWSIADEMTFYLVFPLLMLVVTNIWRALAFFAVSVAAALGANALAGSFYDGQGPYFAQFTYYWLPNQLPVFALGFVTFYLIPWARSLKAVAALWLMAFGMAVLLLLPFAKLPYTATINHPWIWRDLLACAGFMGLILSLAARPWSILVNPVTTWLGKVSFSSYLLQFAVLQAVLMLVGPTQISGAKAIALFVPAMLAIAAANTALASITYHLIEEPWMKRGHRVAKELASFSWARRYN